MGTLCILQVLNNALPHSKCIKWCLENSLIKCYDRLENHLWQLASKLDFVSYFVCICAFAHYPNSNFSLPPEYADLSVMQVIYGIVNDLKNWVIVKGDVKIQPLRVLGYGIFFLGYLGVKNQIFGHCPHFMWPPILPLLISFSNFFESWAFLLEVSESCWADKNCWDYWG